MALTQHISIILNAEAGKANEDGSTQADGHHQHQHWTNGDEGAKQAKLPGHEAHCRSGKGRPG
jgi:hypothetical protein